MYLSVMQHDFNEAYTFSVGWFSISVIYSGLSRVYDSCHDIHDRKSVRATEVVH